MDNFIIKQSSEDLKSSDDCLIITYLINSGKLSSFSIVANKLTSELRSLMPCFCAFSNSDFIKSFCLNSNNKRIRIYKLISISLSK